LAFGLPATLITSVSNKPSAPTVFIVAPTRELAIQIHDTCSQLSSNLMSVCLYGGVPKDSQRRLLKKKVHFCIGTPGRLIDLINEGALQLDEVKYLVLDEADRMLDQGFERDIRSILSQTPKERQTLMFSATWPEDVRKLASEFLRDPVTIQIGSRDEFSSNQNVTQIVEVLDDNRMKDGRLRDLLKDYHSSRKNRILIFALYKKEAIRLESIVARWGYKVVGIHGDKSQEGRMDALSKFKSGAFPLMIATDVAARGLDIPDVEYVINNTFPLTIEDYIHRIGRTGRAGKTGIAHTFFTSFDKTHSGGLINVLKSSNQNVPDDLMKFGTTGKWSWCLS
jgi:ATP-dependent RNA helicase DBP3